MNDIKSSVARNISSLRQMHGMTQSELAEKLNYSDKAVSKWERAESMPDISVLVKIADIFGVSLDALVRGETAPEEEVLPAAAEEPASAPAPAKADSHYNHRLIMHMSIILVWIVALVTFVLLAILAPGVHLTKFLAFAYAVPASAIVWLVLNSIWFIKHRNYLIISLLMWSLLLALCLTLLPLSPSIWTIMLLGIPGQAIILIWSMLKKH